MLTLNSVTTFSKDGAIGIVSLNSPPVNALSAAVREGLQKGFEIALADPEVQAIVLICEGKTFIAGADISEFAGEMKGPSLYEVQEQIEDSTKPVVAAIHGTALGGGLEVALCAHFRVAVESAKCGLPEVNLGILPGAGGTQRLPRLVGVLKALEMVTSGKHVSAKECLEMGLIDSLVAEDNLRAGAVAFAKQLLADKTPLKKVRDSDDKLASAKGHPEIFSNFRKANERTFRGFKAPEANVQCIEAAVNLSFDEGIKVERKLFMDLIMSKESAAQRYYFFAERMAAKIPDVGTDIQSLPIKTVAIVGAGTMGGGIAMNFANAKIPVTLVEVSNEALLRGLKTIRDNYERSAKRGRFPIEEVDKRMRLITGSIDFHDLGTADLIIEAVYERMDVKKSTFQKLDAICKPGAVLATNTSALNIDEIASVTKRPESVIGMHFFSPANVMRLLEVVRADHTSKEVIATAMKVAKVIGKVAVLVGVAPGFVGNRMLYQRGLQAQAMLMEGAMPWDIDKVLYDFGFPMGPFAMGDLAGLDLGWVKAESKSQTIRDVLCEADRRGQKTGAGYYDYDENRASKPSPFTEKVIKDFMAKSGATPRTLAEDEIRDRCIYAMINEGAKILEEKKAIRASDIDVVWVNGYGWPVYLGGPMYYADQIGLAKVHVKMKELQSRFGDAFKPAALLETLALQGKSFSDV